VNRRDGAKQRKLDAAGSALWVRAAFVKASPDGRLATSQLWLGGGRDAFLHAACVNLIALDGATASDPVVALFARDPHTGADVYLDRTEIVASEHNPVFEKKMLVEGMVDRWRAHTQNGDSGDDFEYTVRVYDADSALMHADPNHSSPFALPGARKLIGVATVRPSDIMNAADRRVWLRLRHPASQQRDR
jgi:hypothetical protein